MDAEKMTLTEQAPQPSLTPDEKAQRRAIAGYCGAAASPLLKTYKSPASIMGGRAELVKEPDRFFDNSSCAALGCLIARLRWAILTLRSARSIFCHVHAAAKNDFVLLPPASGNSAKLFRQTEPCLHHGRQGFGSVLRYPAFPVRTASGSCTEWRWPAPALPREAERGQYGCWNRWGRCRRGRWPRRRSW